MPISYLSQQKLHEILGALTDAGMANSGTLDSLLVGINKRYASSLPEGRRPIDRALMTLDRLNTTGHLSDGSVPFITWLQNAAVGAAEEQSAQNVFNHAVALVSAAASGISSGPEIKSRLPHKNEEIVHQNDLLPFSFLRRGAEKGAAVARLTVTRHEGGAPALINGRPQLTMGTGWLLTRDLLITNHHVINARSTGEHSASPGDLQAQALGIEVGFDYDESASAITIEHVRALEAFSPSDGPLDYAILRLTSPVDRKPLEIVPTAMIVAPPPASYPAVNIIQHPLGRSKQIGCRNNTVFKADGVDLLYFTDTMGGSSGSPVFDDAWKVVALHKKWDYVNNVSYHGKPTAWANAGTQIFAILADLTKAGKADLLAEILKG